MTSRAVAIGVVLGILAGCKDPPKEEPKDAAASTPPATPSASTTPSADPDAGTHYDREKVLKLVNPSGLPPYQGPTASVEGTIVVRGAPPPATTGKRAEFGRCPQAADVYGKIFRAGDVVGEGRALADAIVAVTGYEGFVPAKSDHVDLRFESCAYDRRTVLVTFGQRIDVYNGSKKELVTPDLDGQPVLCV